MERIYAISAKTSQSQLVKSLVLIDDKDIETVKRNFDIELIDNVIANQNTNDQNTNDQNTNDQNTND
jgi:hypothetical protein